LHGRSPDGDGVVLPHLVLPAQKGEVGKITIHFGGDPEAANGLRISLTTRGEAQQVSRRNA
jgi:hypothetical protein